MSALHRVQQGVGEHLRWRYSVILSIFMRQMFFTFSLHRYKLQTSSEWQTNLYSEIIRMLFSSVANLQRSASASAGGVGTQASIFLASVFQSYTPDQRKVRRKGQGGSKAICSYDFLFPRYGRVLPGDHEFYTMLVFFSSRSSQLEAKTLRTALQQCSNSLLAQRKRRRGLLWRQNLTPKIRTVCGTMKSSTNARTHNFYYIVIIKLLSIKNTPNTGYFSVCCVLVACTCARKT